MSLWYPEDGAEGWQRVGMNSAVLKADEDELRPLQHSIHHS